MRIVLDLLKVEEYDTFFNENSNYMTIYMSSNQQIPPWLQEQIAKLQQTQQNLQMTVSQKQQLEFENIETEKSLEELKKVSDDDAVFKFAGTILVKSNKQTLLEDLEEKKGINKN